MLKNIVFFEIEKIFKDLIVFKNRKKKFVFFIFSN
jgi:hypothetical protein